MRFIAAVPNYNHGESLIALIDQLLQEDIDQIYVLDDASTDNSIELLKPYENKITVIEGPYNLGPAGNRNRIIPHLKKGDIVMSIDADMKLESTDIRNVIMRLFEQNKEVALFGGGIFDVRGRPMTYNYGIHQSQIRHVTGVSLERLCMLLHFKPLIKVVRPVARRYTYNVEIRYFDPVERVVNSVSEAHYYILGDVFKKLNGYNENLQYHEGSELDYRIRRSGKVIKFTPELWATHLEINPRNNLRLKEAKKLDKIIANES